MKLFYIQKIYCLNNINSRNISNEINKWIILVFSEPQELPKVHSIRLLILWDPSSWHPPFQGPPQTLNLLSVGPSSWVHKMLAVVHRRVHEPLLLQAVVGGPAVCYYECTRSHMPLDEGDQGSSVPLVVRADLQSQLPRLALHHAQDPPAIDHPPTVVLPLS